VSARHAVAGLAPTGLAQAQAVAERLDPVALITSPCGARGRRQLALFLSMTQRTVVGVDLSYDLRISPNLGRILLLERWARI